MPDDDDLVEAAIVGAQTLVDAHGWEWEDLAALASVPLVDLPWVLHGVQSPGDLLTRLFAQKIVCLTPRFKRGTRVRWMDEREITVICFAGHDPVTGHPRYLIDADHPSGLIEVEESTLGVRAREDDDA